MHNINIFKNLKILFGFIMQLLFQQFLKMLHLNWSLMANNNHLLIITESM